MAISDVSVLAGLTEADVAALAVELDAIRTEIEDCRGERDARYIYRTIAVQRGLEVGGRVVLAASCRRWAWWAGAVTLGVAKIVENMEIGHNVMHGQWDELVLAKDLAEVVEQYLANDVTTFLAAHGMTTTDIGAWVTHPGAPRSSTRSPSASSCRRRPWSLRGVHWAKSATCRRRQCCMCCGIPSPSRRPAEARV